MIKLKELLEQTCDNKLPGETNAQWRARCGPRPLGKIPMGEQEEKKIHSLVSNWEHEKAQVYASVLIEKYGDWILYKPKFNSENLFLWAFPYLVLIFGGLLLVYLIRKGSKKNLNCQLYILAN